MTTNSGPISLLTRDSAGITFGWPTEINGLMDNFLPTNIGEGAYGIPDASQGYTGYAIAGKYTRLHPNFVVPAGVTVLNDQDGLRANFKNYAPRVGFAWVPLKKTSIRGGFGLFLTRTRPRWLKR